MMDDSDKELFARLLKSTMSIYSAGVPSADVLKIWWGALLVFSFDEVRAAFDEHTRTVKYQPKPSEIIEIIEKMNPDGRPSGDVAWSMVPRDEMATAILNDEIFYALRVAQPLLDCGDQVAARMAFKSAYETKVDQNKRHGIKPKWFVSLGHDKAGRATALQEAVSYGRISQSQADKLLPSPDAPRSGGDPFLGVVKQLVDNSWKSGDDAEKISIRIAALRAALRKKHVQ